MQIDLSVNECMCCAHVLCVSNGINSRFLSFTMGSRTQGELQENLTLTPSQVGRHLARGRHHPHTHCTGDHRVRRGRRHAMSCNHYLRPPLPIDLRMRGESGVFGNRRCCGCFAAVAAGEEARAAEAAVGVEGDRSVTREGRRLQPPTVTALAPSSATRRARDSRRMLRLELYTIRFSLFWPFLCGLIIYASTTVFHHHLRHRPPW